MAARTLELDFTASGASSAVTIAGGTFDGSGGAFIVGDGYKPGRAERIVFNNYANASDFAGDWHVEVEVDTAAIAIGAAHNTERHKSYGGEFKITSITRSGTTATVTVDAHECQTGDIIYIQGSTVAAWNGTWTLTSTTSTTLVFTCAGTESNVADSVAVCIRQVVNVLFRASRQDGTANEYVQIYRTGSGILALGEKSGGVSSTTTVYVSGVALRRNSLVELDEISGVLYLRVDGALVLTKTRAASTTSQGWQQIYIAGASSAYLNNFTIRRFKLTNEASFTSKVSPRKVAIFGDSFVVHGAPGGYAFGEASTYGPPRYSCGFVIVMQQEVYRRTGTLFDFRGYGHGGHGWSETHSAPLSDHISAVVADNPEIVVCHGSVNDVTSGTLASDYEQSLKNAIDTLTANDSVRVIIFCTIPAVNKSRTRDTPGIKSATDQANEIIKRLPQYNSKVWVIDEYSARNGKGYDPELVEGSTSNSVDKTDLHWSPLGHAQYGHSRATAVVEALLNRRQTSDRRFLYGGASNSSPLIPSLIGSIVSTG